VPRNGTGCGSVEELALTSQISGILRLHSRFEGHRWRRFRFSGTWPSITSERGAVIAKPSQTFKKRQREMKLREKAQLKRQRRQQRAEEKAQGPAVEPEDDQLQPEVPVHEELGE
jgi:hypothetical protein